MLSGQAYTSDQPQVQLYIVGGGGGCPCLRWSVCGGTTVSVCSNAHDRLQLVDSRLQDPEQFEADGGWSFLDMEGESDEEEEESEEGDPEFQGDSEEQGASSEEYRSTPLLPLKPTIAACNWHLAKCILHCCHKTAILKATGQLLPKWGRYSRFCC